MFKSLGVMIAGMFVGALVMEVFRKACPDALDKAYERSREIASGAKEAFQKGYEGITSPRDGPEPQA